MPWPDSLVPLDPLRYHCDGVVMNEREYVDALDRIMSTRSLADALRFAASVAQLRDNLHLEHRAASSSVPTVKPCSR